MKQVKTVLVLSLAACTSWRVETRPLAEVAAEGKQRTVRVYLKSGERVELFNATIVGDSVIGFTRPRSQLDGRRVAVATNDVAEVMFLTGDSVLSALAVIGIVVLVAVGALAATCASLAG